MSIHHFRSVSSTQDIAKQMIKDQSAESFTFIYADEQTKGRGRQDRIWHSPDQQNLYCSALVKLDTPLAQAYELNFVTALAVFHLCQQIEPKQTGWSIKWPNDVLFDGQKTAGILLETESIADQNWVIIGMGLNLNFAPENVRFPVTYLKNIYQKTFSVPTMLDLFVEQLKIWYELWKERGFSFIRNEWLKFAYQYGKTISVTIGQETITGIFHSISDEGFLELQTTNGMRSIYSGDVIFS